MQRLEIMITGLVPDDNIELGHEAIVETKGPVHGIVEYLAKLGLKEVKQHKSIRRVLGERPKKEAVEA